MSGYSKQWCDIWNKNVASSFDIDSIAYNMNRGEDYPIVCKGFQFKCIHKDAHGVIWVAFNQSGNNYSSWKRYNTLLIEEKNKAVKQQSVNQ